MPDLRITDSPSGRPGGGRRVEVQWQDGPARRMAVASVDGPPGEGDGELVRWYLEEYAQCPADPAPRLAASVEAMLAREGTDLFRQVFSGSDAAGIWERARDRLGDVRVEIDSDPDEGPGLPWELLRDPSTDTAVALSAGAFVRTHLQAAAHPRQPEPSGDRLRVLLVICRPGGRADVPFRSVASRLVRGGADRMEGLELDVLRPATFARLADALRGANAAGRPYHVVHFDGHGTYLDVADLSSDANGSGGAGGGLAVSPLRYGVTIAGPVRSGQHGYLLFEAPTGPGSLGDQGRGDEVAENMQLVDGPTLGRLLVETNVPVLVLNACRSAYAEAASQPGAAGTDADEQAVEDVHARIRAYGSLAAEVADAGVPGVVAMRYNVYVVTAAQFVADLYAQLLAGRSLGVAVAAARRGLAADPNRRIGASPIALQDWVVPLSYEAAPLALLRPDSRTVSPIRLMSGDGGAANAGAAADGLPRPPDAGFFGRDETLLALDRVFDLQRLVLLQAFAGAGKSSTAAEFGRWYRATGGLDDPAHREQDAGPVLWSSFENHLTADQAIGMVGAHFAGLLEANGIAWAAITDPAQRRDLVLQILRQIPVLWVWDNVEPIHGFPAGSKSAWTPAEQDELAELLRDLAQQTRCKVLLTSRRDERGWLGDLPARVGLPPMPIWESVQLATAIAARRGQQIAEADWRPLLRFAAGNPLTTTIVSGQALRENLRTADQIDQFVRRLEAGQAGPESDGDAALGRTRSLAASLDYGFAHAFTDAERAQLAVLHLFRGTVADVVLLFMSEPSICGDDAVLELAGLDAHAVTSLFSRAADIGLLSPLGGGFYAIHPGLPWYFTSLFTDVYGPAGRAPADRVVRAYVRGIGILGTYANNEFEAGHATQAVGQMQVQEANLLHGVELARGHELWVAAVGCMRGLRLLYARTGRVVEWGRLVADIVPDVTNMVTGGPRPGRADEWSVITHFRVDLAGDARDWPTTAALLSELLAWSRAKASEALAVPAVDLTDDQRDSIHNLAATLNQLGIVTGTQGAEECLSYHQEALALVQLIGDRAAESSQSGDLGNVYLTVPGLRNLDEAGQTGPELLKHLSGALSGYAAALQLVPPSDQQLRAILEGQVGVVYAEAGDAGNALAHFQRAIQHCEATGDIYKAGQTRYNVALMLVNSGRTSEALHYARAAIDNFYRVGAGAASDAARADELITILEQRGR